MDWLTMVVEIVGMCVLLAQLVQEELPQTVQTELIPLLARPHAPLAQRATHVQAPVQSLRCVLMIKYLQKARPPAHPSNQVLSQLTDQRRHHALQPQATLNTSIQRSLTNACHAHQAMNVQSPPLYQLVAPDITQLESKPLAACVQLDTRAQAQSRRL